MKEHAHYITEDSGEQIDFGEGMQNIYALPDASVLRMKGENVQLAVHEFGQGKSVYISGLPYNNTYEHQDTVVYDGDGKQMPVSLEPNAILWFSIWGLTADDKSR